MRLVLARQLGHQRGAGPAVHPDARVLVDFVRHHARSLRRVEGARGDGRHRHLERLADELKAVELGDGEHRVLRLLVLNETDALAPSRRVPLNRDEVRLAEGFEHSLQIALADVHVEAVHLQLARAGPVRLRVDRRRGRRGIGRAERLQLELLLRLLSLPRDVLLSLASLDHHHLVLEHLPGQRECIGDGRLVRELDVRHALAPRRVPVVDDANVVDSSGVVEELVDVALVRLGGEVVREHRAGIPIELLELSLLALQLPLLLTTLALRLALFAGHLPPVVAIARSGPRSARGPAPPTPVAIPAPIPAVRPASVSAVPSAVPGIVPVPPVPVALLPARTGGGIVIAGLVPVLRLLRGLVLQLLLQELPILLVVSTHRAWIHYFARRTNRVRGACVGEVMWARNPDRRTQIASFLPANFPLSVCLSVSRAFSR